jgi:hypothetical protein
MESGEGEDAGRRQQLYCVTFQLSIYASKQSKIHINLGEDRL